MLRVWAIIIGIAGFVLSFSIARNASLDHECLRRVDRVWYLDRSMCPPADGGTFLTVFIIGVLVTITVALVLWNIQTEER
jgi:hypothetical protein